MKALERRIRVACRRRASSFARTRTWLGPGALGALAALVLLAFAAEALARPGGGGGFSGGGGGGFSGGGRSGGGGGDGDLIVLLVWLAFRHPAIGIPLLLVVGTGYVLRVRSQRKRTDWSSSMLASADHLAAPGVSPRRALEGLRRFDPDFSLVVFEDFLYALYQKAQELRGAGRLETLSPYLNDAVRNALHGRASNLQDVSGVVVGSMRFAHVTGVADASAGQVRVRVAFEANYTERYEDGGEQSFYVAEQWNLVRRRDAKSRPPDKARVFECPSCGAPLEGLQGNVCGFCNDRVDTGEFDWVVTSAHLLRSEPRPPPLAGGAEEVGTQLPTIRDPQVAARWQALQQKDAELDYEALQRRVTFIHGEINAGWTELDWKRLRPYMSDSLFEAQTYWLEAYEASGLRNVLEHVRVTNVELAAVTSDKWYDAVTLRVFANGLDYTVRRSDGRVVGGSKRRERPYSEYWALIRGRGTRGASRTDASCPSCGAPLEVNQGGTCEYCKARVTTGDFDWVLSRIEQDEAYAG